MDEIQEKVRELVQDYIEVSPLYHENEKYAFRAGIRSAAVSFGVYVEFCEALNASTKGEGE